MSANEYKDKANAFLKNKEYDLALEMYNKAVELAPEDKVHWSNRSACYYNLSNYQKALEDAIRCTEIAPTWSRGFQRKGQAEVKLEKVEEAISSFKKGLTYEPESQTLKDFLADAERTLKSQTENPNPWAKNMGKLYTDPRTSKYMHDQNFCNLLQFAMKDQKMLIQLMQTDKRFMDVFAVLTGIDMSKMDEESQGGQNNHSQDHQKKSEEEQRERQKREEEERKKKVEDEKRRAEEEKQNQMSEEEKAELLKVKKAEEIKLQGNVEFKKQNYADALKLYSQALEMNPNETTYHLNLAATYHELKEYENAIAECEKLLEKTFDFQKKSKALGRMGFAYQELKQIDKAIKCFSDSLLEFKDPRIKEALRAAEGIKKKMDAEAYISPEKAEIANNSGNDHYKNHDWVNAIKDYSDAVKRDPKNPKYYSNRAACYIKLMSLQEALTDCEKALELDPNFLRAHQRFCNVQMMMKRYHKALSSYEKAVKLFPTDSELREGYQKCVMKINEGGDDEERLRQTMNDPEIQSLMVDVRVQQLLKDLKENPKSANEKIMKDEFLGEAFRKLVASGIIKTK